MKPVSAGGELAAAGGLPGMAPPVAELLSELRRMGMPIGIPEHRRVAQLLARWEHPGEEELRAALGALLARSRQEVHLVEETFDRLCRARSQPREPISAGEPRVERAAWSPLRGTLAGVLISLVAATLAWQLYTGRDPFAPLLTRIPLGQPVRAEPSWERPSLALLLAALAGCALLWLRRSRRRGPPDPRRSPTGPWSYELVLAGLVPPFGPALLHRLTRALTGVGAPVSAERALDVERSLRLTLREGLVRLVRRMPRAHPPLLVLEDIGSEMAPWRWRIAALLAALGARGVRIERWLFRTEADRVFQAPDEPAVSLQRLAQLRPGHRLLVISTGFGVLAGEEGARAGWVGRLTAWNERVWVHPSPAAAALRPALALVPMPVLPMSSQGLLAAAEVLTGGGGLAAPREMLDEAAVPVAAADVETLRWLVSLAPRRDPRLAERLRQEFSPDVPAAALAEALAAPPPSARPATRFDDAAVRRFLLRVLADSEPRAGTVAWERWRRDREAQAAAVEPPAEPPATPRRRRHTIGNVFRALGRPRVASLLALGFACGLPFLLTSSTLGYWLRDEGVVSQLAIGFLSWIWLVYAFKFLWSPLVDRLPAPFLGTLGRRRGWVVCAQLLIIAGLIAMAAFGTHGPGAPVKIVALALVVAFGSATQDMVVDAFRIEAAKDKEELSLLTAAFQLGYRAAFVTNALALALASNLGWQGAYGLMALLMSIGVITAWRTPEPARADAVMRQQKSSAPLSTRRGMWDAIAGPLIEIFRAHGSLAVLILILISVYRLPEFLIGPVAGPFYHDLGLAVDVVGGIRASVGLTASVLGIVAGGVCAVWLGLQRTLVAGALMQGLGAAAYGAVALLGPDLRIFAAAMASDNFCSAFAGVAFVAYTSSLVSRAYTATQYALLSSLYALPGRFLRGFSGTVVDALERALSPMHAYAIFYVVAGATCLPALILCIGVSAHRPRGTLQRRASIGAHVA